MSGPARRQRVTNRSHQGELPARAAGTVRLAATLAVMAVGLLPGACGAGTTDEELGLAPEGERRRELAMEVRNLNFYDAVLYAVSNQQRVRVGFVSGNGTENFRFLWPSSLVLQIEIHLISVGSYLSDPLPVEEGDDLELIIEPDLHRERPVGNRRPG